MDTHSPDTEFEEMWEKKMKDLMKFAPIAVDVGLIVSNFGLILKTEKVIPIWNPIVVVVLSFIVIVGNFFFPLGDAYWKSRNRGDSGQKFEPEDTRKERMCVMFILYSILAFAKISLAVICGLQLGFEMNWF